MNKVFTILATGAFALVAPAVMAAGIAHADNYFTGPEMQFLADEASIGVHPSGTGPADYRQPLVNLGWAANWDVAQGTTPTREASVIYHFRDAPNGVRGISMIQAAQTVEFAIDDLTGTSPSPGGITEIYPNTAPSNSTCGCGVGRPHQVV
jgi:hypothetical protein